MCVWDVSFCLRSCVYGLVIIYRTQVRRGPPDSSPQQTGTSRTVKRYPSSSGPITSNALPNGNGYSNGNEHGNWYGNRNGHTNTHSHNTHRPTSNSQLHGQFSNALLPAGKCNETEYMYVFHLNICEYHKSWLCYHFTSSAPSYLKTNAIATNAWRNSEWPQYMHTLPVVSLFNISHEEKLAASQDALPFSLRPNTSHPLWSSSHAQTFRIKAIAVWACARLRSYVLRNLWEFTQTLLWHDRHWTLVAVGNVMWTSPVFSPLWSNVHSCLPFHILLFLATYRSDGCWTASHHYTVLTYTLFVSFTHTHIQNTFSQR